MKRLSPAFIILAGVLWGTMGIFVRRLNLTGFHSMEIIAFRSIFTALVMLVFLGIYNRRLLIIKWSDIWCFIGTGLFSIVFFNYCYFKTITLTSLSVAAILLYTAPMMVMIFSVILFKEKLTRSKVVAMLVAFLGCILVSGITGGQAELSFQGFMTGLGSGLGYALYSVFSRYALEKGYHPLTITVYTFIIASIGVIPLADMRSVGSTVAGHTGILLFGLVFALFTTILPYLLYTKGLTHVEAGQASIMASVEPIVASILGVVLFHEKITLTGMLGIAMVILSIYLLNRNKHDSRANEVTENV